MKRLIMLFLLFFVIAGCSKPVDQYDVITENKGLYVHEVGEVIKLNVDSLATRFDFNRVEFHTTDAQVARINYKEELLALRSGKTQIQAKLFDGSDCVALLELGTYFIISPTLEDFTPINTIADLQSIKASGLYYLNNDLDMTSPIKQIPLFEGLFINPNHYKISNLQITSLTSGALFKNVREAYISDLIFSNFNFTSDIRYQHVLAENIQSSYILGVKMDGKLMGGHHMSPLTSILKDSIVKDFLFEGMIEEGMVIGGMASRIIDSQVSSIVIDATLKNTQSTTSQIGGISAYINQCTIKDALIKVDFDANENDIVYVVGMPLLQFYYLQDIRYYESTYPVYSVEWCLNPKNIQPIKAE